MQPNPDNMTRKQLIKCIEAFEDFRDAEHFWVKWALGKVSKAAFYKARGYRNEKVQYWLS